jgi:V/A-type H+-transporting ATPase subunit D
MAQKAKLTKSELKRQKDSLKRFERYLPTLQLKKQQLQLVMRQIEQKRQARLAERDAFRQQLQAWIAVFGEPIDLTALIQIERIETSTANIAGIDIPVFEELTFVDVEYDLFEMPLWVDQGINALKHMLRYDAEISVLEQQYALISEELHMTTQRVNLFEKVKIPEAKEVIRVIQIYLGDQQTAAVVRGKMAKGKMAMEGQA